MCLSYINIGEKGIHIHLQEKLLQAVLAFDLNHQNLKFYQNAKYRNLHITKSSLFMFLN